MHSNIVIHTDALLPPRTLPKDLKNEELVFLFNNHPILMATEYHHDIGRFKSIDSCFVIMMTHYQNNIITEAKLSGKELLSLDKGSLEQFQFSSGFQKPLLTVIEDLVCHQYINAKIIIILVLHHVEKVRAIPDAVTTTKTKVIISYHCCRSSAITLSHYCHTARYV